MPCANHGLVGDMTQAAEAHPDDPETLKAMLIAERQRAERLIQIIKDLQLHRFRAEGLPEDQLLLALEEVEQSEAGEAEANEAKSPAARAEGARKRRANRGALPPHLPRIETLVDVEDKTCPCCRKKRCTGSARTSARGSTSSRHSSGFWSCAGLNVCRACEDIVVQSPAPARLIEGSLPTEATVAHVLVSKYADHLPLYRQAQIYERQGLRLDRSALADWVGARRLPSASGPRAHSGASEILDEAVRRRDDRAVLDPGRGRTKTGQLWAYARDDRPWGGTDPPAVGVAADRASSRFKGVLRYLPRISRACQRGDVTLAFCWAHLRRRFYERAVAEASPIANEALQRIAALYRIENDIRGCAPDTRRAFVRNGHVRCSPNSNRGCAKSSPSSARRANSPRRSATRSRVGTVSPVSSTTGGSSWTPTRSSDRSDRLRGGFHCAPHFQVSGNIGSGSVDSERHGRPFRAIAAVTACECRSLERI